MTKQDFLEELRRMLNRELEADEVAENIRYYSDYIDGAVQSGKSEAQVLSELGDPRMIARTILDVDQQKEEQGGYFGSGRGTVFTENEEGAYHAEEESSRTGGSGMHHFEVQTSGWKVWLIVILVLVVVIGLLGTVFAILWKLLPFILICAAVVWVYRFLTGK